jgi:carboxypeptidase Taq
MNAYTQLEARNKRSAALGNAMGILGWDQSTIMRDGSAPARAEMMAELSLFAHEMAVDPKLGDLISEAESDLSALDDWQKANLREMRHSYRHSTAVPADLIEKMVIARSESAMVWRKARAANDFASLAPKLDVLFDLTREYASAKADAFGVSAYNALLDNYDAGRTTDQVDTIFADLEATLPGLIEEVLERQASAPDVIVPEGPFSEENQKALGEAVMKVIGFPFDRGRLDVSHHPFSGGADRDVRITTRYDTEDFTSSLMAVIHETGHALYEDGLPLEWRTQPVGENRGMTLHESQSLLLEMQAARSDEFIKFITPTVTRELKGKGPAWSEDNLIGLYRKVKRGLIRVDADELTYPLHVILRYRLERAILNGEIATKDLPGEWNKMMQDLVGITPPDDKDGVMQDVHWPEGIFGYFPTYSLGALTAAQLFASAKEADTSILPSIGEGNFAPLFTWLNENVRSKACLYSPEELIENATGKPLGTEAYKAHIKARYLS